MNCEKCGACLQPGAIFCARCGTRQRSDPGSVLKEKAKTEMIPRPAPVAGNKPKVTVNIRPADPNVKGSGKLLRKMMAVTKFSGEPTIGVANKIGTLTIYDDRVEFVRKAGLTLVGTLSALSKQETDIYYLRDLAAITTGSYMGMYTTLVLQTKTGDKVSFCPSIPMSKDMETVAAALAHYK